MSKRLRAFMDYLRSHGLIYNDSDFCKKIGKNSSMVSEYVRGKRTITHAFVNTICTAFPILDDRWLLKPEHTQMLLYEQGPVGYVPSNGNTQLPAPKPVRLDHMAVVNEDMISQLDRLISVNEQQAQQIDRLIELNTKQQEQMQRLLEEILKKS